MEINGYKIKAGANLMYVDLNDVNLKNAKGII